METYLPEHCYNQNTEIKIGGITLHYISAINVDPNNALDTQACWNLLIDLNFDRLHRLHYPMKSMAKRVYASYHSLIGRDGEEWLTVPANKKAYHAGVSKWEGRANCNMWMYGLGIIGTKDSGFTDEQYATIAKRCAELMLEYRFHINMIAGHEEISPGRKSDPGIATGNFDIVRLRKEIGKIILVKDESFYLND